MVSSTLIFSSPWMFFPAFTERTFPLGPLMSILRPDGSIEETTPSSRPVSTERNATTS